MNGYKKKQDLLPKTLRISNFLFELEKHQALILALKRVPQQDQAEGLYGDTALALSNHQDIFLLPRRRTLMKR